MYGDLSCTVSLEKYSKTFGKHYTLLIIFESPHCFFVIDALVTNAIVSTLDSSVLVEACRPEIKLLVYSSA